MLVIPAIDIKDGQCVRLKQGKAAQQTTYSSSPLRIAEEFIRKGAKRLHIVDLNGTLNVTKKNKVIIDEITAKIFIPIQIGGGIRSLKQIQLWLDSGVNTVIIGTLVIKDLEAAQTAVERFGPERLMVALDARDGKVAINGWQQQTEFDAIELGKKLKGIGFNRVLYTDIARDGMLIGPNLAATKKLAIDTGLRVTASGGISSRADLDAIQELEPFGVDSVVVGRAFYENRIQPEEVL